MNLAQSFQPARPLAQHCAELTERGPRPEERAAYLSTWRRDVAREVAQDMADLLSGAKLEVSLSEVETTQGAAVYKRIGPVAANSLLRCGADDQTALLSISIETAIALTDRSFGGPGEAESTPPESLPRSAALLVEQAGQTIARAIARVSAGGGQFGEAEGDVIVRSENASRLKPFSSSTQCAVFTLEIRAVDGVSWAGTLAMGADQLDGLLPGLGSPPPANDDKDRETMRELTHPVGPVFGDMPLPLKAVLAEFELSLGQIEQLAPGDTIPLATARHIPLRLDTQLVAGGTLGTIEGRLALKLTSIPHSAAAISSAPLEGTPA
ncbi:MAG: FliM/FliN family flagellar motor switch protein [Pseudomonadota bacterium]